MSDFQASERQTLPSIGTQELQTNDTHGSPTSGSILYSTINSSTVESSTAEMKNDRSTAPIDTNFSRADESASETDTPSKRDEEVQSSPLKRLISAVMGEQQDWSGSGHCEERSTNRPWRTALIRFGPLSGVFCMLLAIASLIACLGILAGSNTKPATWSVPPSSALAICTAVANLSVRYAAIQGVVICWWLRALRGSTLAKLHWDWRSGTTLRGALTAGRHMGLLGLACILSTLVVIDGPLIQRSSSVRLADITNHPVSLNVTMAPEVPKGYTGVWGYGKDFGTTAVWDPMFNDTVPTTHGPVSNHIFVADFNDWDRLSAGLWYTDVPLFDTIKGCPGECKAKLRAPALAVTSCESHVIDVNFTQPQNLNQYFVGRSAPPLNRVAFLVATTLVIEGGSEKINLITGYSTTDDCAGSFNYTICTLESAIGEYDVTINGGNVTIDSADSPNILALANNTQVDYTPQPGKIGPSSTLAGIVSFVFSSWDAFFAYTSANGVINGVLQGSPAAHRYLLSQDGGHCSSFKDPRSDVIASYNKLMIYTGMLAGHGEAHAHLDTLDPGLEVNSTITGYWGWWHIGRPVSFSPLELAKAFEAPAFTGVNSNSSGRDIAKAVGDVKVQYGVAAADRDGKSSKLTFADPAAVGQPQKGSRFDV